MERGLEDDPRWRQANPPLVKRCRNCDRKMTGRHCENRGCPWCSYCGLRKDKKNG